MPTTTYGYGGEVFEAETPDLVKPVVTQSSLADAAQLIGEQRLRIKRLEDALKRISEMDGDQPARSEWDMLRIARDALAKSGEPK